MTSLTQILFAVVAGFILILWFYSKNRNKKILKSIPGPPPLPILGNILDVKSTTDVLDVMMKYTKEYGGLIKVYSGPVRVSLLVTDYKFLEFILSSSRVMTKSEEYQYLHPWLGTGLLTSEGTKWRKHRRILTPAFHFQILEQFLDVFESGGNRLVQKLEKEIGKKSVDIYPYVTLCTLDIICETAMGTTINAQDDGNSEYVRSVKDMCRIIIERSFSFVQMFDFTYLLSKNYYIQKRALRILHRQTSSVIKRRQKELLNEIARDNKLNTEVKTKRPFLDILLQATVDGRPLTDEEIREEVDTFMFEGHDTTASGISFTLFCIANHPEVQKKAYEEQVLLFGDNKHPVPTYSDLQSMKYLEQVIKEGMRLYPPVPNYGRCTTEPVKYNGITIPKNIQISIFAFGIHRDPQYFKNPDEFNPSRFDEIDGRQPYAYIPFSAGPRNCIGQKFAMLEMKSTISKIIRNFVLIPAIPHHTPQLAAEAVLKSANGIKIGLKSRT